MFKAMQNIQKGPPPPRPEFMIYPTQPTSIKTTPPLGDTQAQRSYHLRLTAATDSWSNQLTPFCASTKTWNERPQNYASCAAHMERMNSLNHGGSTTAPLRSDKLFHYTKQRPSYSYLTLCCYRYCSSLSYPYLTHAYTTSPEHIQTHNHNTSPASCT